MEILSDECIVNITHYLRTQDFVNLCLVSLRFSQLSYDRRIWKYFFMRDFINTNDEAGNLATYERIIGPITNWKTSYFIVNNNVMLRSDNFILITKLVLGLYENGKPKFEKDFKIYDFPQVSRYLSFAIPDQSKLRHIKDSKYRQIVELFRKKGILYESYITWKKGERINIFTIYGTLLFPEDPTRCIWFFISKL